MLSNISSFLRATSLQGHCLELILVEWLLSGPRGSCHCSIPLTNCYIFFLPYTQPCRKEFEHCLIILFQTPLLYRTTSTWLSLQERSGIQLREPTLSITQLAQSVDSHSSSGTCRPFFSLMSTADHHSPSSVAFGRYAWLSHPIHAQAYFQAQVTVSTFGASLYFSTSLTVTCYHFSETLGHILLTYNRVQ